MMKPFVYELATRLPENIITIDLKYEASLDCLFLLVFVVDEGIYRHKIDRQFLENNNPADVGILIASFINSHVPPPILSTAAGAEEYDMAMEAQDAMDKLSPQS